MTEEKKKQGRPALQEVYCLVSVLKTSKGPMAHGDRLKLPLDEATRLIKQGKVE